MPLAYLWGIHVGYTERKIVLQRCLKYFPNAEICGDDWDYPPVRDRIVTRRFSFPPVVLSRLFPFWPLHCSVLFSVLLPLLSRVSSFLSLYGSIYQRRITG